jgi:kynurenine formamidase
MMYGRLDTADDLRGYLRDRCNWGRWGEDDQVGALNLITAEKRLSASRLVKTGQSISLSREIPKLPAPGNPHPSQHYLWTNPHGHQTGAAHDYFGLTPHGANMTHLDALSHMWGPDGMWGGRRGAEEVTPAGARWGGIEHWRNGITTRGVLLDVPGFRGMRHVAVGEPVHGWELENIARSRRISLEPGDALFIYGGRERFEADNPSWNPYVDDRPGVAASCLPFIRDHDIAVLGWDFLDLKPLDVPNDCAPHAAIHAFGVALIDNCALGELAAVCAENNRYEFLLAVSPLVMIGATGSPVNPIALL